MLAEIYGWFTEGFDTADLIAATVRSWQRVRWPQLKKNLPRAAHHQISII